MSAQRHHIPVHVRNAVLTEAGFRCAVPACRSILALDLHHIVEVSDAGGNEQSNLLALCPTCHALYTRGTIPRDSIHSWKALLVALNRAFDVDAIDNLHFLSKLHPNELEVSGDGVLKFSRLISAGLAGFSLTARNGPIRLYDIHITDMGSRIIDAWKSGDRAAVQESLAATSQRQE